MGRLIDVDDLIGYLGFKDTQEERDNNYAQDITLEEIDRIEMVNVAEREEVKKLIREAKEKAIDDFYSAMQTDYGMKGLQIKRRKILKKAAGVKEQLKKKYLKGANS